jgi:hypothetical protein
VEPGGNLLLDRLHCVREVIEISTKRIRAAVAGMRSNSRLHLSANELLIETDHVKFVTAELDKRGGP